MVIPAQLIENHWVLQDERRVKSIWVYASLPLPALWLTLSFLPPFLLTRGVIYFLKAHHLLMEQHQTSLLSPPHVLCKSVGRWLSFSLWRFFYFPLGFSPGFTLTSDLWGPVLLSDLGRYWVDVLCCLDSALSISATFPSLSHSRARTHTHTQIDYLLFLCCSYVDLKGNEGPRLESHEVNKNREPAMISCPSPPLPIKTLVLNTYLYLYRPKAQPRPPIKKTSILPIRLQIYTLCLASSLPTNSHILAAIFKISRFN